jgi:hypothetical protein
VRSRLTLAAGLALVTGAALWLARPEPPETSPVATHPLAPSPPGPGPGPADAPALPVGAAAPADPVAPPHTGWHGAARDLLDELRGTLRGTRSRGAYAEARAEAARADLAAFAPPARELHALLRGGEEERLLALAALAARPPEDDDTVRLVLRGHPGEPSPLARLLGAEIAAGLSPATAARHEDDLARAFEDEPSPLVLAAAVPALERLAEPRLAALLRAQLARASPEMRPVLAALARARLSGAALAELGLQP